MRIGNMESKSAIGKRLASVSRVLENEYEVPKREPGDPLDELVFTILSQNTNDTNRDRAYEAMRKTFPTWYDVMNAPRVALEKALKPGGLARTKSARIQKILKSIKEQRDELNLDYLRYLPAGKVEEALKQFKGVGPKTARCVLLFALGREAFPIDTHILRALKRLGVIPPGMTAAQAHEYVPQFVPKGTSYPLHLRLIAHGKAVCHPRNPECHRCVVMRYCVYHRMHKDV